MKRLLKIIFSILLVLALLPLLFMAYVHFFVQLDAPEIDSSINQEQEVIRLDDRTKTFNSSWSRLDETGIWEMYSEGAPFARGFAIGRLTEDLLHFQEHVFLDEVKSFVPNGLYRRFLLNAIQFYNRDLNDYVTEEYQQEIYGVSISIPEELSDLGNNYQRKLSYHAAHDIGHAFQNMGFVSGCTALAFHDEETGDLLLGRNFDFYAGDDFAKNKVLLAMRPDTGHAFISLSWAGMMGVLSGMNEKGLVVALNAGPSAMPKGARTPVTLIAREIVQYASTISEAIAIAERLDVFVSENIIVASQIDGEVAVIEKSPGKTSVYRPSSQGFVCSNHFLSDSNKSSEENDEAKRMTSTQYRFDRAQELLASSTALNVSRMVEILRDTRGLDDALIGLGNEMALNQITGHHSVFFNLDERSMYVAGLPSQLGRYYRYDVDSIFNNQYAKPQRLWTDTIPADQLIHTEPYADYGRFRAISAQLKADLTAKDWSEDELQDFIALNPKYFEGYQLAGAYFYENGDCERAVSYLERALRFSIPWEQDKLYINDMLDKCGQ